MTVTRPWWGEIERRSMTTWRGCGCGEIHDWRWYLLHDPYWVAAYKRVKLGSAGEEDVLRESSVLLILRRLHRHVYHINKLPYRIWTKEHKHIYPSKTMQSENKQSCRKMESYFRWGMKTKHLLSSYTICNV